MHNTCIKHNLVHHDSDLGFTLWAAHNSYLLNDFCRSNTLIIQFSSYYTKGEVTAVFHLAKSFVNAG
jgi:hypothetical protein